MHKILVRLLLASVAITAGPARVHAVVYALLQRRHALHYQLATNIFNGAWASIGSSVAGTGAWCAVTNNMNGVPRCFFRLQ